MAKQQTVYLNVAFDKLRGKLATKQRGILYSGQVLPDKPSMLPIGQHSATNFRKYIVLNEREGKAMFYVKSRQTLGVSRKTSIAWAALAAAASMADSIVKLIESGTYPLTLRPVVQAMEYWSGTMPLRRWLTGELIRQLRAGKESLEVLSVPDEQGLSEWLAFATNPFASAEVPATAAGALMLVNYMTTARQRTVYANNVDVLAILATAVPHSFKAVTRDLRERSFGVVADGQTYTELATTINGRAFNLSVDNGNVASMTFYNPDGSIFVTGVPYADEARTTRVDASTALTNGEITTLYF